MFRRSLFVVEGMRAGESFTRALVRSIRTVYGLPPKLLPEILGRQARRPIKRDMALSWDLIT